MSFFHRPKPPPFHRLKLPLYNCLYELSISREYIDESLRFASHSSTWRLSRHQQVPWWDLAATHEPHEMQATHETDADDDRSPKATYKTVVEHVHRNTGYRQPPVTRQSSVLGSLHAGGYGSYGLSQLHKAIVEARRKGDLLKGRGPDGVTYLGIRDADSLLDKIESHIEWCDEPHRPSIALANSHIQQLRYGGGVQ